MLRKGDRKDRPLGRILHCTRCNAHLFGGQPITIDGYLRTTCAKCGAALETVTRFELHEVRTETADTTMLNVLTI